MDFILFAKKIDGFFSKKKKITLYGRIKFYITCGILILLGFGILYLKYIYPLFNN